ncbi:MAG: dephospho-CoA kinase [Chloroflexota bacterium]|nr:dephospho-CoA kinase [Chloroflexota bacterium]
MGKISELGDRSIIGLTGNIACGKSTVLTRLAALGAGVLDADVVTRRLQARGAPAYERMVAAFGSGILQAGGEIDRKALGNRVFADPAALRELEALVRPLVRDEMLRQVAAMPQPIVVIDAIGLLEGPLADWCREIWVVTCPPEQQVARLITTRGFTEAEARLRVQAQRPQAEKVARATRVFANAGTVADLLAQVDAAWAVVSSEL